MSILWCGGEDIDFPNGFPITIGVNPPPPIFRAAYARCGLQATQFTVSKSTTFAPQTSAWLTCQLWTFGFGPGSFIKNVIGLGLSGTDSGLFLGSDAANSHKLALMKFDGTTTVQLAAELGTSLQNTVLVKLDMQVVNFGAAATVNVYLGGVLLFSFTGDVTVPGMAAFDSVFLSFVPGLSGMWAILSEMIVADEDTRPFALSTLAPAGPGTTSNWTGAWSDINEIAMDDATEVGTNNPAAQDWQCTLLPLVAGNPTVRAVMIAARSASPLASAATKVGLGVNAGGTVNPGVLQSPGAAWVTLERLMPVNPVTGLPWTAADMGSLQLNLRSGA